MSELVQNLIMIVVPAVVTWFLARRKNDADAKNAEIEAEVKAAEFYRSLLDDAMSRLDKAITTINEQEEKIKKLIATINLQDENNRKLVFEVEHLAEELKKYKQLNGKALS